MASFWKKIRKDFPNARRSVYLDHAAGGPVPAPVASRIKQHLEENAREADFAWPRWTRQLDEAREKAARFINADPDEVAFIQSTSQGMNYIADMAAGEGKVLASTSEFPSSTLPWLWRKARMVFQTPKGPGVMPAEIKKVLPGVKTILTSYVQYATGFRQDLEALGKMKGNRFLAVNATQGFGVLPVDVKKWNADFLCTNSYKWLMAGYGGGLLYVRRKWLKKYKPASLGWRSVVDSDKMDNRNTRARAEAARYEFGCSSFSTIFAVTAAIDYLSGIGMRKIEERVLELTDFAVEQLQRKGFRILSSLERKHRSGIVIVGVENPEPVWRRLLGSGIFTTVRGGGLRLAPHFYNSMEEIEFFVKTLAQCRDKQGAKRKAV
ncbi:MAG TPA: aminotransferase class V-fold PLP-dependent enzyme [Verrucomicrobiae bacterium]|jgi:selenocysteine lyase/cysteine desulfurase|nr:aminotransferase class V-fold PLP-dependent enzyme [Verrucomicrobiae bacterium]